MAHSTAEIAGFLDQVGQLMQSGKDTYAAGGLNVTSWITRNANSKNNIITKDAEKDALKAASKAKTKESDDANLAAYKEGSTMLDALIGVLGKDTPAAKQAARLRSSLNGRRGGGNDNSGDT
jgi:bifunctional pyridoxal-dependent enzyme with beta-cystathionase and maltose regulon repressor activities